ncbi:transcription initiation factor IIB [Natronosalvus rutilus]|uniref:Transcription initiation factor IIB n=1 Tax=Natronosalvus rutilus TaxID=2953753 RepID=A0A9E7N6T6_9EURY|nr:TFIIB-type zinc ribbon-containing protein [Natronosalvus rutilus]UTF52769.1 hypothetical protein NGM29_13380 [Natronosalvus rutilus]
MASDPRDDSATTDPGLAAPGNACPNCEPGILESGRSETYCDNCGYTVNTTNIDPGPEWRAFDDDSEDPSRVGAPSTPTLHDKGLSTTIGHSTDDQQLGGDQNGDRRQRKLNRISQTRNSRERTLRELLSENKRMCDALEYGKNVEETASVIIRKAVDEELHLGRSIEAVASAAVYAAARIDSRPCAWEDIVIISRLEDEGRIVRTYKALNRELALEVEPPSYRTHVNPVAEKLNTAINLAGDEEDDNIDEEPGKVTREDRLAAQQLVEKAQQTGAASGKDPRCLAAAAIYVVLEDEFTQREFTEYAAISRPTLQKHAAELRDLQD